MFYNLKIAVRNLRSNSLYSIINIAGLAISLTIVILIMLWIQDELSYNKFHPNARNIYRLNAEVSEGNIWTNTPAPIALFAKNEQTEIEQVCRTGRYNKGYFDYNNQKFYDLKGSAVDDVFFTMFNFTLIKGEKDKPFTDDFSIILSETKAKTVFGEEDPIGKTLQTNDNMVFHVTGIMKDMPENSTMKYDYIVPFDLQQQTFEGNGPWKFINEDWGSYHYETYILVRPQTDIQTLSGKIGEMVNRIRNDNRQYYFRLQSLLKIHLYTPNGDPQGMKNVWLFGTIAILILIIACINYINLVTGRSIKRSREMGIRKVIGAKKSNLLTQLLLETILLFVVSVVIATVLIYILLSPYNQLAGKEMSFNLFSPPVLMIYGITTVSVIILAGLYPAFFISSFKPLEAFRNKTMGHSKHGYLRKTLVVIQFTCSFALITATIAITKQLDYMRHKDLGYNKENVFTFWSRNLGQHYDVVKNELLKNKDILGVSAAESRDMERSGQRVDIEWPEKEEDRKVEFFYFYARNDFFELMNVPLVAGEYLSPTDTLSLLVNEEAVRTMGIENPVGTPILNFEGVRIKGVVKDYNFESLNEPVKPMLIMPPYYTRNSCIYVKTTSSGAKSAITSVEKLWKQYNPDYEFSYSFIDENFDNYYKSDIRSGKLFSIFAFFAIFISCLGLFGLITYIAETKTKEIGIRKVLGASISDIVNMLSREFLILVGIAMLIAFPLAYYWLDKMFQDYAYRISIGWWMFILAAIITIALTLLTVGWQAIKAATANPVKSIKIE